MSSTNSYYYHHGVNSGLPSSQNLPPLRSVLGDQLDLPFTRPNCQSPYDLGEIYKALPRTSGDSSDYQNPTWSRSIHTPHADSRHSAEHSGSHKSYAYPSPSTHPNYQPRSITPTHGDRHPVSRTPPHTISSSRSGTSKKYACTWEGCEKRFERQHALDTHMNIHLEQKPFACPVRNCGKVFNVRSNMRRHLLTHKDIQMEGRLIQEDDGQDDERANGHYYRSRHDHSSTHRRSSEHPRITTPAQSRYSSSHRV